MKRFFSDPWIRGYQEDEGGARGDIKCFQDNDPFKEAKEEKRNDKNILLERKTQKKHARLIA